MIKGINLTRPERQVPDYIKSMSEVIEGANSLSPEFFDWFKPDPDAKAAVAVSNGSLNENLSDSTRLYKGCFTDNEAGGLHIVSSDGKTGGVFVDGNCSYEIADSSISVSGDAVGIGGPATGIAADNGAHVTVDNCIVDANGLTHYALVADRGSVVKAYGSTFASHGAPFGHGEPQPTKTMTTPPPSLMIAGNSRTFCGLRGSQSFFYDCLILADGWAALSTEAPEGYVYVEANDSRIVTVQSGYAVYSDPGTHIVLNRCDIDSADMIGIIGGEADITMKDCCCDCGANGFLAHSVFGDPAEISTIDISGGCIHTRNDFMLIKSRNFIGKMDGVELSADNNVLVHTIKNEDPLATAVGDDPFGVELNFSNMDITGDILHEDEERSMYVYLNSTTVRGKIQNAYVHFDKGSKWCADGDSSIYLVGDMELSQIDAPEGVTVTINAQENGNYELMSGGRLIVVA